ncbi:MAG: TetR/AcrR family transcriptional regulator [Eubacteriales bacterium]|nr:TetR/AcrR family transcriptional regulator [Eubacteriales bacterium]
MSRGEQINPAGKKAIIDAFFILMDEKPFSSITVSELVKKAGVARATYYRNFYYKEDIIRAFLSSMHQELFLEMKNTPIITETVDVYLNPDLLYRSLEYAFRLCYKNREYLLIIMKNGLGGLIQDALNEYAYSLISEDSSIDAYQICFIQGAGFHMVMSWLSSGAKETPAEMTRKLVRYLSDGVL